MGLKDRSKRLVRKVVTVAGEAVDKDGDMIRAKDAVLGKVKQIFVPTTVSELHSEMQAVQSGLETVVVGLFNDVMDQRETSNQIKDKLVEIELEHQELKNTINRVKRNELIAITALLVSVASIVLNLL